MNDSRNNQASALSCAHSTTTVRLEPVGSPHYAKLICANCGVQLRILPRPESVEQRKRNAAWLEVLRKGTTLNSWERRFIDSLAEAGKTKLSPAQQEAFDRIVFAFTEKSAGQGVTVTLTPEQVTALGLDGEVRQ